MKSLKTEYTIDATGDCCKGDQIEFIRDKFEGVFPKSQWVGQEKIRGIIIKESYGPAKQQHTFTILQENGCKIRIKGRNLYRYGVNRKPWISEAERIKVLEEKHKRGAEARRQASIRRNFYF